MSSSDRVWDWATRQWVRYSSSRRHWIDENGRRVNPPQRTQDVTSTAASSSSHNTGIPSQPVAVPGRQSATNIQAATDSMRSLTVGSAPTQGALSGFVSGQGSGNRTTTPYAAATSDQRTSSQGTSQGSAIRTTDYTTAIPDQRTAGATTAQGSAIRTKAPYNATVSDQRTGLQTRWEVSETTQYNDPGNVNSNRALNVKRIRQVEGRRDKASKSPENDYKAYRVIEVLLVPPEDAETSNVSRITPTNSEGPRLRRFVITREVPERNGFEAVAIKTYNGRGVGAPGVIKAHHSIIYTSPCPRPTADELPGRTSQGNLENGMQPQPIRVVSYDRGKALDPMARLDYADRYDFDWGVSNIRLFGRVHEDSHAALFLQYNSVWQTIRTAIQGHVSTTPSIPSGTTARGSTAPAGASHGLGASSTAATAGGSTRAASSTSGTAASEVAAARALYERFASRNSGACTYDQMSAIIRYLQGIARGENRRLPGVSAQRMQDLARNPEIRAAYIRQIEAQLRGGEEGSGEESGGEESDE